MKELSVQEKAKAYDEALKEAVIAHKDEDRHLKATLERIFPEIKDSEDERIRKEIIEILKQEAKDFPSSIITEKSNKWIAWLEKQGEHAKFRNKIQIGDKVTRNKDGVLVNLSQLDRVAKQGEKGINGNNGEIPNSTWSKEDKEMCQETIDWFEKKCFPYAIEEENPAKDSIKWLKSLKDRYTWKPSDEQMEFLWKYAEQNNYDGCVLTSLFNDLKKLKQ